MRTPSAALSLASAVAAAVAPLNGPASGKLKRPANRTTPAKKAADETGGHSQATYVKACLAREKTAPALLSTGGDRNRGPTE